jgi:hypothetical protein
VWLERGDASLVEWCSDRRCAAEWGEVVRPDGYAVWVEGEKRLPFLFEYDRASERLARLEAKLPDYAALARAAKQPHLGAVLFPDQRA